jgi:hypothetical protein
MIERLDEISDYRGQPYGRVHLIFDAEDKHLQETKRFRGYLALSDAFKSFILETTEAFNVDLRPRIQAPLSEFHAIFVPRLIFAWQSLCGAERLALHGYPLQAYATTRNVFDSLQALSAALQGLVDFYATEGVVPGQNFDLAQVKKLRRRTETEVSLLMSGSKSGLSQATIAELAVWDEMFNYEVHGARLSLAGAISFMKGQASLPLVPSFKESDFAMFMNRYCEIAWMLHRLVPLIQPPSIPFDSTWKEKWVVIDDSFELTVHSLTKENGKAIGGAIVEYVRAKFPFDANATFPLR